MQSQAGRVIPITSTEPVTTNCNVCNRTVTTRVEDKIQDLGYIWCLVWTFVFSCCCIGLLAFCMKAFKKYSHFCPNCNNLLAVVKPEITDKQKKLAIVLTVLWVFFVIFLFILGFVIIPLAAAGGYYSRYNRYQG